MGGTATNDNVVSNVSTTVGTPAPSTSGLQQTPIEPIAPIAVVSPHDSIGILAQDPIQSTDTIDPSGARMGLTEILLLSGGLAFFVVCLVGANIIVRRSRPGNDVSAPDEERIIAFMMAHHKRLGTESPAADLDERVMRLILQFAGLISQSESNSEGKNHTSEAGSDLQTGFDDTFDDVSYVSSGSSGDWNSETYTSDGYSDDYIDIPHGLKRGRDYLLEMIKEDRSKRRKRGDPVSSSDEEKDEQKLISKIKRGRDFLLEMIKEDRSKRRKRGDPVSSSDEEKDERILAEQIQEMATNLRQEFHNSPGAGQKSWGKTSKDPDGLQERRTRLLKMTQDQRRLAGMRGELVSSSDEERDKRRAEAHIQFMANVYARRRTRAESKELESLLMDPEGVHKRREHLLAELKKKRTERREQGEPASSSDEEKDMRRVHADYVGLPRLRPSLSRQR